MEIEPINWRQILREEVENAGSIQAVANQLGYARTSISLALGDNYKGRTDKIRAKVIATFCDRIICTHTGSDMSQFDCTDYRDRALPQSDPEELRHWLTCQSCPNNPNASKPAKEVAHA